MNLCQQITRCNLRVSREDSTKKVLLWVRMRFLVSLNKVFFNDTGSTNNNTNPTNARSTNNKYFYVQY